MLRCAVNRAKSQRCTSHQSFERGDPVLPTASCGSVGWGHARGAKAAWRSTPWLVFLVLSQLSPNLLQTSFKPPFNLQPSTFNLQPSTFNLQPSTFNLQPSTFNLQPSTFNLQPQTSNLKPLLFTLFSLLFTLYSFPFTLKP